MGMNLHVRGVRNLDGQFQKMMNIKLACDEADSDYPQTVIDYFSARDVGDPERELRASMEEIDIRVAVTDASRDMQDIREVDLSKLPKETKRIRFVVTY
jgi:hypothetical protein